MFETKDIVAKSIIAATAIDIASYFTNGWALSVIWSWLVASQFVLPELSIAQATGIVLVASLLVEGADEDMEVAAIKVFVRPAVFVGIGYVISLFL